jgi:hypothetical protein
VAVASRHSGFAQFHFHGIHRQNPPIRWIRLPVAFMSNHKFSTASVFALPCANCMVPWLCRTYLGLDLTAEAQSAPRNSLLIKKYSELRELSASVVK